MVHVVGRSLPEGGAGGCGRRRRLLLEVDPTLWCVSSWNDNSHAAASSGTPAACSGGPPPPPPPSGSFTCRCLQLSGCIPWTFRLPHAFFLLHSDVSGCLGTAYKLGRHIVAGEVPAGAQAPGQGAAASGAADELLPRGWAGCCGRRCGGRSGRAGLTCSGTTGCGSPPSPKVRPPTHPLPPPPPGIHTRHTRTPHQRHYRRYIGAACCTSPQTLRGI